MDEIRLQSLLAACVVLLFASAFFSVSETSMMALNRYRWKHLARTGSRGARLASDLLAHTDRLRGVVLLGNNLVNTAAAALVTLITFRVFGESELALAAATVGVTFAILVFSEITPKVIGAAYPERIALPAAYVLSPLLRVAYPVVWFVNLFVRGLLTILRPQPQTQGAAAGLSLEELRTLVLEGGHFLPPKHQKILLNLFDLQSITVANLMTPRSQIEVVSIDAPPEELKRQIKLHMQFPLDGPKTLNGLILEHLEDIPEPGTAQGCRAPDRDRAHATSVGPMGTHFPP